MKKILVTGGTVFVSRFVAEYYLKKGEEVYVLNRNRHTQPEGAVLIEGDRKNLGEKLRKYHFDVILDITSYTAEDVNALLDAVGGFEEYIMISSSAVYPETLSQPFTEGQPLGANRYWGAYGTDKIAAEQALTLRVPQAYILRPPYLYGPMNNVYREAFVFDCALLGRKFYVPRDGGMQLQFFHVEDMCRFMDIILEQKPRQHIFNVGNAETVSVAEWVRACYAAAGKEADLVPVWDGCEQRNYFSFYDYDYCLDVSAQCALMPEYMSLQEGLKEAYLWYRDHRDEVIRREYMAYIDSHFVSSN